MLRLKCPGCGKRVKLSRDHVGKSVRHSCGKKFKVRDPEDLSEKTRTDMAGTELAPVYKKKSSARYLWGLSLGLLLAGGILYWQWAAQTAQTGKLDKPARIGKATPTPRTKPSSQKKRPLSAFINLKHLLNIDKSKKMFSGAQWRDINKSLLQIRHELQAIDKLPGRPAALNTLTQKLKKLESFAPGPLFAAQLGVTDPQEARQKLKGLPSTLR